MATNGVVAEETLAPVIGADGKWTSGFKGVRLDCPLAVAWDMFADWGNWSWQTSKLVCEVREGESGKPGCMRFVKYPIMQLCERVLEVDEKRHFLKYNIEENSGGLKGYIACIKFKESEDGKTMVEYWTYEMEPLETATAEAYCGFLNGFLMGMLGQLEKGAKNLTAQPGPDHVKLDQASAE